MYSSTNFSKIFFHDIVMELYCDEQEMNLTFLPFGSENMIPDQTATVLQQIFQENSERIKKAILNDMEQAFPKIMEISFMYNENQSELVSCQVFETLNGKIIQESSNPALGVMFRQFLYKHVDKEFKYPRALQADLNEKMKNDGWIEIEELWTPIGQKTDKFITTCHNIKDFNKKMRTIVKYFRDNLMTVNTKDFFK